MNICSKKRNRSSSISRLTFTFCSLTNADSKKRAANFSIIPAVLKSVICFIAVPVLFLMYGNRADAAQNIYTEGAEWHYFKGGTAKPPKYWTHVGFNDSGWQKGQTAMGYGNSSVKTHLHDMRMKYKRIHARRKFPVNHPAKVNKMFLSVTCDGAYVAYINGIEVIRNNAGLSSGKNFTPSHNIDISGFKHELLPGNNVISVQCENDDINSDNFTFTPIFEINEE